MSKPDEFSEVLRLHGDMAYRMACHLTRGNEQLSRDLVQDAFIKVWKNWESQRPESFKGWLYRILHNLYMDHLRKKTREATDSYDVPTISEDQDLKESYSETGPLLIEQLEQEELNATLHRALLRLPEDFRLPVVLCDMEGMSYEEIAQVVSCPIGTVRSRIHRGRLELRRALVPTVVAVATALGAYFLCRAQQTYTQKIRIPIAAAPRREPVVTHALLPHTESSNEDKGESRDN